MNKADAIAACDVPALRLALRAELNDANIPDFLKMQENWLVWRVTEINPTTGKFNKIPIYPKTGSNRAGTQGSDADRANLGTFAEARAALERDPTLAGIGVALLSPFQLVGFDADKCVVNGSLRQDVADLTRHTYCEFSPSGTGVRAFWKGIARDGKNHESGFELFHTTGFVTVTGNQISAPADGRLPSLDADMRATLERLSKAKGKKVDAIQRLKQAAENDPILNAIIEANLYERDMGGGKHSIECPFEHEHSDFGKAGGDGDTVYLQPHTDGFAQGHFNCLHAHCANRTDAEYLDAIGFSHSRAAAEMFADESLRIGEGCEFSPIPDFLTPEQMLERFTFLSDGSRVFDTIYPAHILPFSDFRNATAASFTEIKTGDFGRDGKPKTKRVPNALIWMNSPGRKTAVSASFKAGDGLFITDPNGRHCVNLWSGFQHSDDGSPDGAGLFLDHINWLLKERADEFIDWLAHIKQRPGQLPHTAWLHIASHTGTGRNALSAMLARVFRGYTALSIDLIHMLDSGFNERLSRKVLAVCDEIREGGAGQWKHSESLKQMITAPTRNINVKFGRQCLEHNACRFLLFSNHRSAIPLDDRDRRFEIVINDDPPKDADYYTRLYAAIADPVFIASIGKYLTERDLSKFNPGRHAAKTADRAQVIEINQSAPVSALVDFGETYPYELATSERLQMEAGLSAFGGDAIKLRYAAQDAGWEKLGRKTVGKKRLHLYVRREHIAKWKNSAADYRDGLPFNDIVNGGLTDVF